jgi:hypothetical protein
MKAAWMVLFGMGCGSSAKTSDDTGGSAGAGGGETAPISDFINTIVDHSADLSCGVDPLITEIAIPGCAGRTVTMSGLVSDFETNNPVDEARVEIFQNDAIVSAPDHDTETDFNGMISAEMETCTPFTYRASTDPAAGLTKTTIQAHNVLPYVTTSTVNYDMNSVGSVTYGLISTLFGINPSPSNGVVAGRTYDCDEDNVEGMQVVVKNASGEIPGGMLSGYFIDDFPSKDQPHTSADGLWMIIDVPPGQITVEGYVFNGVDYTLIGSTTMEVLADSVNVASIYTGLSDGQKMPDSCLEACAR